MLIQELVTVNNRQFTHTYSSDKKFIKQIESGALYNEAFDTLKRNFHYIETDTLIPEDEFPTE